MKKRMSAEARRKISESMKRTHAARKANAITLTPVIKPTEITVLVQRGRYEAVRDMAIALPVEDRQRLVIELVPTFVLLK